MSLHPADAINVVRQQRGDLPGPPSNVYLESRAMIPGAGPAELFDPMLAAAPKCHHPFRDELGRCRDCGALPPHAESERTPKPEEPASIPALGSDNQLDLLTGVGRWKGYPIALDQSERDRVESVLAQSIHRLLKYALPKRRNRKEKT